MEHQEKKYNSVIAFGSPIIKYDLVEVAKSLPNDKIVGIIDGLYSQQGWNFSKIAKLARVERKTLYDWKRGANIRAANKVKIIRLGLNNLRDETLRLLQRYTNALILLLEEETPRYESSISENLPDYIFMRYEK